MKSIRLADIVVDAGTQVRVAISEDVVSDYAEQMGNGIEFPAVVLFHDGNHYYLGDGFHRVMAARRAGWIDIGAEVRQGTQQDALWFALGANRENGQRLTAADKRHAIALALAAWPDRSMHQIADQIGCTLQPQQADGRDRTAPVITPNRKGGSSMWALIALPEADKQAVAVKIARAFRRAGAVDDFQTKEVEGAGLWDHGQLQRQLNGTEHFQLDRAGAVALRRSSWFARFVWFLSVEFGCESEVMSHAIGHAVAALLTAPGQARMARVPQISPRNVESECDSDSGSSERWVVAR